MDPAPGAGDVATAVREQVVVYQQVAEMFHGPAAVSPVQRGVGELESAVAESGEQITAGRAEFPVGNRRRFG